VTAVLPTQDGQTYLATTLDAHARLMDGASGARLADFSGHSNTGYRCRAVFGHAEASVVCGDEDGRVWAWDLLSVRRLPAGCTSADGTHQGAPMEPNPPPRVHDKVITWTEHHPTDKDEMVTASADGTVKVWRNPS
jgi:mitogen-activated protein kinase organizer 1